MLKRWSVAIPTATAILVSFSASEDDVLVRFKGGIGVIPVSSGLDRPVTPPQPTTALNVETVNRNIVRGVQPPGQIWVIADLRAA